MRISHASRKRKKNRRKAVSSTRGPVEASLKAQSAVLDKDSPNTDCTMESKPTIYYVLLMWQYIYGREGEKSRLQVLFRLQVFTQIKNECERDK